MGGLRTGCTEETVNVFVEAAYFDPIRTARTGRRLKINSDARYRFERGVDPAFTEPGMERATRLILDLCGGEPSEIEIAGAVPATARSFRLDPARVVRLVGMEIAPDGTGAHPRRPRLHPRRARGRRQPRRRRAELAPRRPRRGRPRRGDRPRRLAVEARRQAAHPPGRRRPADPDADAAPRGPGAPPDRRPRLQRVRDLQLHRRGRRGAVRRRLGGGAAREPDQLRDEPHAPRPAARPAARRRAQPGPRLRRISRSSRSARPSPAASPASRCCSPPGCAPAPAPPRDPYGTRRPVDLHDARADAEAALAADRRARARS